MALKLNSKLLLLAFAFLLVPFISAYNVQITLTSNVANFNTDSYKCSNSACSSITFYDSVNSGTKTNVYSLIGSGDKYYAEYDYKTCYAPHIYRNHVWDPYASKESFPLTLNKKAECQGIINEGDLSETSIYLGDSVLISSNVDSSFDYPEGIPTTMAIPSELTEEYSSKTKVMFYANGVKIYETEKEILLGKDKDFEFEWTPTAVGIYNIVVKSQVTDCACSSQNTQETFIGILIVTEEPECTQDSGCGVDYYSDKYCSEGNSYKDFHDFSCLFEECNEDITKILAQDCGEEEYGEWSNYCQSDDLYKSRYYASPGCNNGECFTATVIQNQFVKACEYGCNDGECNDEPEQVCGNEVQEGTEECDDGNLNNGDGCSSLCEIEDTECCVDGDCPGDVALPPTCKNNDVFGNYIDHFCLDHKCTSEIKSVFAKDCGEDYCDNFGDKYCKNGDSYHSRTCYDKGCMGGACFNTDYEDEQLVEECDYGCTNGTCDDEPQCIVDLEFTCWSTWQSVTECRPDNTILQKRTRIEYDANNCGTFNNVTLEETKTIPCNYEEGCCLDSECSPDSYSDDYCYEENVYHDFTDFFCENGQCLFDITKQLVEECDYGCTNGTCDDEPPTCELDSDCQADYYSDGYCKSGDVYRTFYDFSCQIGFCAKNAIQELVEECDYGCSSGECKDKPSDDDDGDDDRIDRDRRFTEDDPLFTTQTIGISNYTSLERIGLGTETGEANETTLSCGLWIWFLIILAGILLLIILLFWIFK